ncbi:MAG: signal peptide peptidase SppA [Sandaracinaceae bacterium]|nr:signal peptide peptidase SppA [Sandaracinaceae bacterium]
MILFLGRVLTNLFRLLTAPFYFMAKLAARPRARWVHIRMRPKVVEIGKPIPFFMEYVPGFSETLPTSLTLIRELVDQIVEDDRIEGVVFDVPPLAAGWATCRSLRELMLRLRAADKKVVVYLSQGGGNRELYVASAADRIIASPVSQLAPLGLGASVTYLKGLLDKAGVEVEVHRRAEYKTAAEPVTRTSMSDEQREQTEALLDTIDGELRDALRSRPGVDDAKLESFFEAALVSAQAAVERGLIDGVGYEDELPTWLAEDRKVTPVCRAPRYYAYRKMRLFGRVLPEKFVAVVPIHGTIQGGQPGTRGGRSLSTTVATLRAARRDPFVAGVVLHVDSPGGSALASDLIHREVERLKELKPVVACFGDVAASGGYYVAACADAVVAQPLTVTGSIGVVSARLVTAPLLEKLGVNVESIRKAPHATMLTGPGRLDDVEGQILDREIDAFYQAFVGVVAKGRGRPADEIEGLARGRVWSGADAKERGLVDRLGGLDAAVDEVRERLGSRLSERARQALRPKVLRVLRLELPPAEPRPVEAAARAVLAEVDPRAGDLLSLARGDERVFCYAVDVPEIR